MSVTVRPTPLELVTTPEQLLMNRNEVRSICRRLSIPERVWVHQATLRGDFSDPQFVPLLTSLAWFQAQRLPYVIAGFALLAVLSLVVFMVLIVLSLRTAARFGQPLDVPNFFLVMAAVSVGWQIVLMVIHVRSFRAHVRTVASGLVRLAGERTPDPGSKAGQAAPEGPAVASTGFERR